MHLHRTVLILLLMLCKPQIELYVPRYVLMTVLVCKIYLEEDGVAVGQGAQDAQELQACVLLRELLQSAVPRVHVLSPLFTRPRHEHLQTWRSVFTLAWRCSKALLYMLRHRIAKSRHSSTRAHQTVPTRCTAVAYVREPCGHATGTRSP
jgi:hypothetical protein